MSLKRIFDRFNKKNQAIDTPLEKLPWSEIVEECHDKQLDCLYPIIRVIYTDDQTERAIILQREDNLYTIAFEKLYPYDD